MHDEFMTRGGVSSPMHRALLAEAADHLTAPHESRPMCQTHAGSGEGIGLGRDRDVVGGDFDGGRGGSGGDDADGAVCVPDAIVSHSAILVLRQAFSSVSDPVTLAWQVATVMHDAVWDAARWHMAVAAKEAGPLPLASSEPWEERDLEYWRRLVKGRPAAECEALWGRWSWGNEDLDDIGLSVGLPRTRLVPVEDRS